MYSVFENVSLIIGPVKNSNINKICSFRFLKIFKYFTFFVIMAMDVKAMLYKI
jgi:hypothetical protein